jgi:hypothetical protein
LGSPNKKNFFLKTVRHKILRFLWPILCLPPTWYFEVRNGTESHKVDKQEKVNKFFFRETIEKCLDWQLTLPTLTQEE